MAPSSAAPADRFGNPVDPIAGYARGLILKGTDEEVQRMLLARQIVGERVRSKGKDSIFDLSGMNRGSGITADDVPHLTSHVPFFERFEGKTEPYALTHMGADPARHKALIVNRVSAANFTAPQKKIRRGPRRIFLESARSPTPTSPCCRSTPSAERFSSSPGPPRRRRAAPARRRT